jgi:hypothetical protein
MVCYLFFYLLFLKIIKHIIFKIFQLKFQINILYLGKKINNITSVKIEEE